MQSVVFCSGSLRKVIQTFWLDAAWYSQEHRAGLLVFNNWKNHLVVKKKSID